MDMPIFFFARFYMATGGRSPIFSRTRGRASISVSVLLPILLVVTTTTIPTSFMMMIITLLARQAARSLCKQWCRPARRNSTPPLQAFSNGVQRQGGNWWGQWRLWLEWSSKYEAQVRKLLQQMLKDRPGGQQGEKLMVMMTMIVNCLRQSYFLKEKTIVSQENV